MAAPSNPTGQPKYAPGNSSVGLRNVLLARAPSISASDGLRIVLPAPAATTSTFYGLVNTPSASASTSTESSSGMKHPPYDVFINHYGKDAKHGIASSIYNKLDATGLRVFLDKNELELGDFFPVTLEAAMRSSSVHIAIFSENYAQSSWCLAELKFILQLPKITFIPIFYNVDSSALRWAFEGKGIYGEAFSEDKMKRRYNSEMLENWKLALHKASFYTGEIISNQGEEEKAVINVVNLVLKELKKVRIDVAKHPVGLDEAEKDFHNTALQSPTGSIQMVGIWGMGGAGKTTLAKHLYNKKYSTIGRSSFLSNVREAARKELLHEKQKKLLEDLHFKGQGAFFDSVDEGKEILRSRLKSVSVLIVVDDVDHTDQLDALLPAQDSLGPGSLIIVTTRELPVLEAWGITAIYKIKTLNAAHAQQLFCWHAFGQPSPLVELKDLAEEFINACHGLPLSLKVFGGLLCGKSDKNYWQSQFDKVSRIVPDDIKLRLRISYDALDEEEKEMFLDIACFFIGLTSSRAIAVWDGSGWNGLHGWQRLLNKCLVELEEDNNQIRMHDHLRDLGREIANRQSPYRLWSKEQIIQIQPHQVAIRVRGMADAFGDNCYPRQGHIILKTNEGERTLQPGSLGLKMLIGAGDFIDDQYSGLSKDLVYLQWRDFQHENLPSWFSLKKLRILQLWSPERLKELWERDADAPSALKELDISEAYELERIENIKSLRSLEVLEIHECPELDGLPGLGELTSLRKIKLSWCHKLQNIEGLESLKSLGTLKINHCKGLNALPSLAELTFLKTIKLSYCSKLEKIEGFKSLTSLEELRIYECRELDGLPDLGESTSLRKIVLIGCHKLQNIEGLESLKSLETLKIDDCTVLNALPSLAELTFLKTIELSHCSKLEKIEGFKSLTSLEELRKDECRELDGLPGLGESTSLRKIVLIGCHKLQNIEGLESLKSLETLEINHCRGLNALPSLAELTFLKTIKLSYCSKLEKIEGFESLTSLEELRIYECRELDGLPGLGESTSLRKIVLIGCHKLQNIEGLESLKSLETLEINDCTVLNALPSLAELTFLETIALSYCSKLEKIEGFKSLTSLEELRIDECPELDGLPGLGESISLTKIVLKGCHKLQNIEGLESLKSLETLEINDCAVLNALPSLAELTSLETIALSSCNKLEKIEGFKSLRSLEELRIDECPELDGLPGLGESIFLRKIVLRGCHKLQNIEGLESLKSLEILKINDCTVLNALPSLAELTFLETIALSYCSKLKKIEGFKSLTSLDELSIDECPELDGLPGLGESISLRKIVLKGCHKLQNIEGLESLKSLETLEINDCTVLNALPSLAELTFLETIALSYCSKLEKIEGFKSLTSLEELRIDECPELDGLPGLGESVSLTKIVLKGCHKLQNIEGLESLKSLETLEINDCAVLNALPSLADLTSLKKLELIKCYKLEKIGGLDSLRSLEMLRIEDCPELESLPSLVKLILLEEFKLNWFEVHACLKAPCRVNLEHRKLIVAVNDVSVVEPFISEIQAPQREVIICTRAAIDVGSLKNLLISIPLKNVLKFTSFEGLKVWRPENADDATAILICFIIDSLYPNLHLHINTDTGSSFDTNLASGKWVWMGVFPQGSDWLQSDRYEIWASSEGTEVEVKVAWLVKGEERSVLKVFHQLSRS